MLKSIFFWDMTTRRHIPEEDTLQNHRCENLKSYTDVMLSLSICMSVPSFKFLIS
jgi:hypothetical protein